MFNLIRTKKGVGGLSDNAIALVVAAVTIGIGATILGTIQTSQITGTCTPALGGENCSIAWNASQSGLLSMETFSDNLVTLALVIVFGIILFFLGRFLARR